MPPCTLPALAASLMLATAATPAAADSYEAGITKWRAEREAELRADDGWLTVAGLFWLDEGVSRFGTAADNAIVLPAGSAPPVAGVFEHRSGVTTVRVRPGVAVLHAGAPVTQLVLRSDSSGPPDVLTFGRLSFVVIERGGRSAVRLRDRERAERRAFAGLSWFPIQPRARVTARFVAAPEPRTIPIPNAVGQVIPMASPGRALFTIDGHELGLDALLESPDAKELFFVLADATTGKGTYPGGRFLYSELPRNGTVVLDFNKAHSPPCAFTPFATCPLPPRSNRLPVPIEAGERYADAAHP